MSGQTADMIADFDTHVPARPSKQRRSDAALPVRGTCSEPRQRVPSSTSNLNAEKCLVKICPKPFREAATIVRIGGLCPLDLGPWALGL